MVKHKHDGFTVVEVLLLLVIASIIGFTGWYVWSSRNNTDNSYGNSISSNSPKYTAVKTFEDCKKSFGSKIQESYPEVCVTKDGAKLINLDQESKNWLMIKSSIISFENKPKDFQIRIPDGWKINQQFNTEVTDLYTTNNNLKIVNGTIAKITKGDLYSKELNPILHIQFTSSSEGSTLGQEQASLKTTSGSTITKFYKYEDKVSAKNDGLMEGVHYEYFMEDKNVVMFCWYRIPLGQTDYHKNVEKALQTIEVL